MAPEAGRLPSLAVDCGLRVIACRRRHQVIGVAAERLLALMVKLLGRLAYEQAPHEAMSVLLTAVATA